MTTHSLLEGKYVQTEAGDVDLAALSGLAHCQGTVENSSGAHTQQIDKFMDENVIILPSNGLRLWTGSR